MDQFTKLANYCRKEIDENWDDVLSTDRVFVSPWKDEFKLMFVRDLIVKTGRTDWRRALRFCSEKLKKKHAQESADIDKFVAKTSKKSPVEHFLKEIAYRWLKYLETHPPSHASWYPKWAVEMAHKVFRLKGKLKTLRKYLSDDSRIKALKSIPFPGKGQFLLMRKRYPLAITLIAHRTAPV